MLSFSSCLISKKENPKYIHQIVNPEIINLQDKSKFSSSWQVQGLIMAKEYLNSE